MLPRAEDLNLARTVIEAAVRLGLLMALAAWCFWLARPFITPLLWGLIIAVAVNSPYQRLTAMLGGHRRTAAAMLTVVGLIILIGPLGLLTMSLVDNASSLAGRLTINLSVPAPPAFLVGLPVIGQPIERLWNLVTMNMATALQEVGPQLRLVATWLLALVADASFSLIKFLASIIVAGIMLANSGAAERAADSVAMRLVGERGPELVNLTEQTVRNVTRGLLGTALVQSILAGIGLALAGVPAAALLAFAVFLLCVIQLGAGLVLVPAVIWSFFHVDLPVAILFAAWSLFVVLIDNVLRPYLMSRGSSVPMVIILIGVLGGLLAHGLIGLFIGPIVLALGYELFRAWVAGSGELPLAAGARRR